MTSRGYDRDIAVLPMTLTRNSCSTQFMKRLFYALTILLLTSFAPAKAAMTDWTEVQGGAVRLIASGPLDDGHYLAGLEFLMEPGWHTYWRYSGEAGIPPQISLSEQTNIKSWEVLYPVPERYNDGFSESIVYQDGIVLPIKVTPDDLHQPAQLTMDVFFGICKDICVPGDASLTLELTPDAKTDTLALKLIDRDLSAVPGNMAPGALKIVSTEYSGKAEGNLIIEAELVDDKTPDLFAAGPTGSYIGLPKLVELKGTKAIWHLSTKGLKASPDDNVLRLVLTDGNLAIEHLEPIPSDWIN
ncbi:MAG: protein-disulfide reductase DsbD domain-containing protein [Roseibium sp.]